MQLVDMRYIRRKEYGKWVKVLQVKYREMWHVYGEAPSFTDKWTPWQDVRTESEEA